MVNTTMTSAAATGILLSLRTHAAAASTSTGPPAALFARSPRARAPAHPPARAPSLILRALPLRCTTKRAASSKRSPARLLPGYPDYEIEIASSSVRPTASPPAQYRRGERIPARRGGGGRRRLVFPSSEGRGGVHELWGQSDLSRLVVAEDVKDDITTVLRLPRR